MLVQIEDSLASGHLLLRAAAPYALEQFGQFRFGLLRADLLNATHHYQTEHALPLDSLRQKLTL